VLGKKDYSTKMNQMNGNARSSRQSPGRLGRGLCGVGYVLGEDGKVLKGIKPLDIIGKDGKTASPLDRAGVKSGKYPLARTL